MKSGGVSSYALPAKRGGRGLALAVLGLVILSMLVPLVFLLGLHNGFHSTNGFVSKDSSEPSVSFGNYGSENQNHVQDQLEDDNKSARIDDLMKRLEPSLPKDAIGNFVKESANETIDDGDAMHVPVDFIKGQPVLPKAETKAHHDFENNVPSNSEITTFEEEKSCELEFGSYCLWYEEHKEGMKDLMVKKMKDQLFVARAYFPSIAKLPSQDKLSREMKLNIQDFERILSETTTDADLPSQVKIKLQRMKAVIAKAKSFPVECQNVDKKLRQLLDLTEDEAHFHMKQSAFLYQIAVETMPKSLHCLSMRLTVEYFRSQSSDIEGSSEKSADPDLHHFVIFSKNVLASSVVINSTVMHSKESGNLVFHVLTDKHNYFGMKFWFQRNSYMNANIGVLNFEDLKLDYPEAKNPLMLSSEEFRVSLRSLVSPPAVQVKTEYISVFGHTHFFLPEIFKSLKKVVVLDDDVVVQQDLSTLWSIEMEGKVNGALQSCGVRLGQLKSYFGNNNFDINSCAWMTGLNIVNLEKWREQKLTERYLSLLQKQHKMGGKPSEIGTMPASLLTFQDQIYGLENSWGLSGLGHDYSIDPQEMKKAAVLHYNGKMKPWLELGIPKYKAAWKKFLKLDDEFMGECNVNP
ncbi:hypothetical protein Sjap_002116 [Stephania japonica]|uniref:Hexosyltransferase n=1 Tax=Stephania japonica TaxID=461633 RepID=A0AAP0KLF6_9MAGN